MTRIAVVGIPDGWSTRELTAAIERRVGAGPLLDMDRASLDLQSRSFRQGGEPVGRLDAVIVKKIGATYAPDHLDRLEMLRTLEDAGVPFFFKPSRILRLFNRISSTVTLHGAPCALPAP